jgi:hypothetical protein
MGHGFGERFFLPWPQDPAYLARRHLGARDFRAPPRRYNQTFARRRVAIINSRGRRYPRGASFDRSVELDRWALLDFLACFWTWVPRAPFETRDDVELGPHSLRGVEWALVGAGLDRQR